MINVNKIAFPIALFVGEDAELVLIGARDWNEYTDSTKKKRLGSIYSLGIKDTFSTIEVKVPDLDESITQNEIDLSQKQVTVKLVNPVCRLYVDNNRRIQVSIKAAALEVL